MDPLKTLCRRDAACDWKAIYAIFGPSVELIAESDLSWLQLKIDPDSVRSRAGLLAAGIADFEKGEIVLCPPEYIPSSRRIEWGQYYGVLLHEIGHFAWNPSSNNTVRRKLIKARDLVMASADSVLLEAVSELDPTASWKMALDTLLPEAFVTESQAQLFSLLVAQEHVRRYPESKCARSVFIKGVRTLFECDDPYRFALLLYQLGKNGFDLHAAGRALARADIWNGLRWLRPAVSIDQKQWRTTIEMLQKFIRELWRFDVKPGTLNDYDAFNECQEVALAFKPENIQQAVVLFERFRQHPLLNALKNRSGDEALRALEALDFKDSEGRRQKLPELTLSLACKLEQSPDWSNVAMDLYETILDRFPGSQARFRAQHRLQTLRATR